VRRASLRGRGSSSSTWLHERSCSQSERAARGSEGRREAARDAPRSEAERRCRVGRGWWWRAFARSPPRHRPRRRATASVSRRARGWAGPFGSASAPCEEDSGAARARRRRIAASSVRPNGSSAEYAGRACASCSPHSRTLVEAAPASAPPMSSPCARRKMRWRPRAPRAALRRRPSAARRAGTQPPGLRPSQLDHLHRADAMRSAPKKCAAARAESSSGPSPSGVGARRGPWRQHPARAVKPASPRP